MQTTNYAQWLRAQAAEFEALQQRKTRKDYLGYQTSPTRFNAEILKRKPYWTKQIQICRAVADPKIRTILVPAGNGVGKSFLGAGIALWYLFAHKGAKVVTTGPTFDQLIRILWANIFAAYYGSELNGQARDLQKPPTLELDKEWFLTGINPDNIEAASGYHGEKLLALVDESSALTADKQAAINSWDPEKRIYLGNPIRPDGPFYELCQRQMIEPDPSTVLIRIPSTESPAIKAGQRRSPDGFCGLDWLEDRRRDYGEDSIWWQSHVLAQFPDSAEGQLIARDWIDQACYAKVDPENYRPNLALAIDLAAGRGGDRSVILVRDQNRLIHLESSNQWSLEETAARAKAAFDQYKIRPNRVVYDGSGLGEGFKKYLELAGLNGAIGFLGGMSPKGFEKRFENLKTAAAWKLRQRLNPQTQTTPFHLPGHLASELRGELQAFSYELTGKDKLRLTEKEKIRSRIGRSPDLADALVMSFVMVDA